MSVTELNELTGMGHRNDVESKGTPNAATSDTEDALTMAHYWHGKDGRWGDRVPVNIPVKLSAGNLALGDGCMRNLSLSGALVKADVDLGLHALIEVSIKMPAPSQRADAVTAYVSRKLKEGVGIEWCEFAPIVVKDLLRSPLSGLSRAISTIVEPAVP